MRQRGLRRHSEQLGGGAARRSGACARGGEGWPLCWSPLPFSLVKPQSRGLPPRPGSPCPPPSPSPLRHSLSIVRSARQAPVRRDAACACRRARVCAPSFSFVAWSAAATTTRLLSPRTGRAYTLARCSARAASPQAAFQSSPAQCPNDGVALAASRSHRRARRATKRAACVRGNRERPTPQGSQPIHAVLLAGGQASRGRCGFRAQHVPRDATHSSR